ncbi:hypothetical protein ASD16_05915 [Cellulomonas sp. Root485]|uniref:VgrG-related protein n=1 Tax=Cellulomonas sp. Root485 TaxID=1736546 RepID=UPI00070236B5|nr:VgrG-related protein [Cellulomonas sp. Root485]KQY24996.1 hypothetical protein ASD16_05915 [Cellulomonas sp. Root485]
MSPVATSVGARPVVKVGSAELPERIAAALRTTIVDTDADGPDSCRLVIDDPTRELLADSDLDLAAELTITAGRVGENSGDTLFDGVVYAIGFDYDDRGGYTTVTAYDRSYGLYNGLHTTSFQNMTDGDIAKQIARDVGLTAGDVATTSVLHEHVSQVNETHIEFLERRGREVGCVVVVSGSTLHFRAPTPASEAPAPGAYDSADRLQLVPGKNLQRLTVRVTAAQQVSQVEVRGWDTSTKQALVATTDATTGTASLRDTPASVAQLFGSPRGVTVDLPLGQQAECDAVAAARAEHLGSTNVFAEGVADGDPHLVAGAAVSLGQTGGRFDGKVTLTRAKHVWDDRSYRTYFTASGSHDRSVLGLVRGAAEHRPGPGGLVVALVTNATDPEKRCRVKVKFPWLDEDYETDWVRVLQLGAGADRGLQLLPEVDDEVLVGFEHGDSRRPYVLGGLYNGVDAPPKDDAVGSDGAVATRVWRSRSGHELLMSDKAGEETLELRTGDDKASVVLATSDGSITITTEGDVKVDAKGNAEVTTQGDLKVEAQGSATIKGSSGLTLESSSTVTIKGSTIKLN